MTEHGVEVGKCYYFISHAYHHYLGRVVAVTGKREVVVTQRVKIHSSKLSWTDFFLKKCTPENTKMDFMSDGHISYIEAGDYPLEIPHAPN